MGKTVISVEHLSKRYDLGVIGTGTISRDLNRWWARVHGNKDPYAKIGEVDHGNRQEESILALDDVSFTVEQGEVLGIIGRNGAGKSTLLKILSQVTAPTSGKVKVRGRIGSLLEVGTGFHPELTGRENIYLNGAILGMTQAEVRCKFDEIVDFSGVEKFIDTPVKRYSSGMYVRLAFAVAAHLDPEILIVDEVLAVGDAEFQKKCLGKMGDVAHEGRTVLFVSHDMTAIKHLCKEVILLNKGEIIKRGKAADIVRNYLNLEKSQANNGVTRCFVDSSETQLEIYIENINRERITTAQSGDKLIFVIKLFTKQKYEDFSISLGINTSSQLRITTFHSRWQEKNIKLNKGTNTIRIIVNKNALTSGEYCIDLKAYTYKRVFFYFPSIIKFSVAAGNYFGTGKLSGENWVGLCFMENSWEIE